MRQLSAPFCSGADLVDRHTQHRNDTGMTLDVCVCVFSHVSTPPRTQRMPKCQPNKLDPVSRGALHPVLQCDTGQL